MTKLQVGIVGAVVLATTAGLVSQAGNNAALGRELAALHQQQPTLAALRAENRQLASAAAEVELLRRDDAELKQLAQSVAEAQRASQENARQAPLRAGLAHRAQLEAEIREKDRLMQLEVDRMNREGNALVTEFKALSAQAKDASLPPDARQHADAAAKTKLAAIQAKQKEIQDYIKEARRILTEAAAPLRYLPTDPYQPATPPGGLNAAGRLELRRSPPGDGQPQP